MLLCLLSCVVRTYFCGFKMEGGEGQYATFLVTKDFYSDPFFLVILDLFLYNL